MHQAIRRTRALAAALIVAAAPATTAAKTFGEWEHVQTDGTARQALVVVSTDAGFAAIVVRCDRGQVRTFVDVGAPLVVRRPVAVRYRFDDRQTVPDRWHPTDDGIGTFAPEPLAFARQLAGLHHLWFEATDPRGRVHAADFPLAGSARAIRPVLAECAR